MIELNDSDLEKLYKAHQAESHDAGLRAVYAAGLASASIVDEVVEQSAKKPNAKAAKAPKAEKAPAAELSAPSDEAPNEPVTEGPAE